MQLKRLLVFAAVAVSMWTVKAATNTADGASTIDSTSNSVYAALCAAGQSKYCDRVKPVTEGAAGTAAEGEATPMDPTRDGIYTALCAAGKTAYCNKTEASQTARDNAVMCILGNTEYCNKGSGSTATSGTGTGTGTTTGTGEAPLLDTSTGNAVYNAMCEAGLSAYCNKTTNTPADQTARDNAVKCILGAYEFCNQNSGSGSGTGTGTGTGTDTTAGTGSTGCATWGGGSGCADGSTGTGTTGGTGTATGGIKDPATQQAVNDVLCKAGQKAYCTGGTTPTSGSSSGGGLMPEIKLLEGDEKTACEVILCLASGQRPDECINPLNVFFSIVKRTLSRTISARKDFLEMCPVVADNDFLKQLTSAQAQGAGRCDVAALNQNYSYVGSGGEGGDSTAYVSSSMPSYCSAMANLVKDPLTGQSTYPLPVYVGVPERGGYWVEPKDYAAELARYTARVKAEDLLASQGDNGGGGP